MEQITLYFLLTATIHAGMPLINKYILYGYRKNCVADGYILINQLNIFIDDGNITTNDVLLIMSYNNITDN